MDARRLAFLQIRQDYLAPYRNDGDLPVSLRVVLYLMNVANFETGIAHVNEADIVKALGAARSTVSEAILLLVRKDLISKVNGKGRSKHFLLRFHRRKA
jgi:Fic family protein